MGRSWRSALGTLVSGAVLSHDGAVLPASPSARWGGLTACLTLLVTVCLEVTGAVRRGAFQACLSIAARGRTATYPLVACSRLPAQVRTHLDIHSCCTASRFQVHQTLSCRAALSVPHSQLLPYRLCQTGAASVPHRLLPQHYSHPELHLQVLLAGDAGRGGAPQVLQVSLNEMWTCRLGHRAHHGKIGQLHGVPLLLRVLLGHPPQVQGHTELEMSERVTLTDFK